MSVKCPHCGSLSNDPEWCDVCGGELTSNEQPWLEIGHALTFTLGGVDRAARVVDVLEDYATRRVVVARLCPAGAEPQHFSPSELAGAQEQTDDSSAHTETDEYPRFNAQWRELMVEESSERHGLEPDALHPSIRDLVHLPLAQFERSESRYVEVYALSPGISLQDYLESLDRLLTPQEALDLTGLLIDAVERVHKAGLFHFQLCPWTIHLMPREEGASIYAPVPSRSAQTAAFKTLPSREEALDESQETGAATATDDTGAGAAERSVSEEAEEPSADALEREASSVDDASGHAEDGQAEADAPEVAEAAAHEEGPAEIAEEEGALLPLSQLKVTFEGIRGFYSADEPVESHPVIMGFSPPEFFGRAPGPLDHRADIFGVGMLFYYLLAGSPPPTGALTAHVPYLPVRAFRYDLAPGYQPFVDSCTAQDPAERAGDLSEVRDALEHTRRMTQARHLSPGSPQGRVSLFCAVDRHIGIGKGRRSPINQDGVFLGHNPIEDLALVTVGDGVSTASYGSGDVASELLVKASGRAWQDRRQLIQSFAAHSPATARAEATPQPSEPEQGIDVGTDETLDVDLKDLARALEAAQLSPELVEALRGDGPDTEEHEDDAPSGDRGEDQDQGAIKDEQVQEMLDDIDVEVGQGRLSLVGPRTHSAPLPTPAGKFLQHVLRQSNDEVSNYINERFQPFSGPVHEVMGTTALTAFIQGDHFSLASLGDSRVYLLRDGHMECLTRDHNLATMRIIEGFVADECLALPQGSALARCLGTFEVEEGTLRPIQPEADMMSFRLLPGDLILLTTDGLIDFAGPTPAIAERNIKAILESEEIPALACLRLIMLANEGGGEDNIGLGIIRVTEHHPLHRASALQSFPPTDTLRDPQG